MTNHDTERATEQSIDISPTEPTVVSIVPAESARAAVTDTVADVPAVGTTIAAEAVAASKPGWFMVRVRPLWLAVLVVALAAGIAATGLWARGVLAEVERTNAAIADARAKTDQAKADAAVAASSTRTEQSATDEAKKAADRQQAISTQSSVCISSQARDGDAIRALLGKQRANYDLTASGSKFRVADVAAWKYYGTAVDYMENAYKAVVAGNISSANTWVTRSNTQVDKGNAQAKIVDKELTAVNKTVSEVNGQRDALNLSLEQTRQDCDV
jgi:hypothetical protein